MLIILALAPIQMYHLSDSGGYLIGSLCKPYILPLRWFLAPPLGVNHDGKGEDAHVQNFRANFLEIMRLRYWRRFYAITQHGRVCHPMLLGR